MDTYTVDIEIEHYYGDRMSSTSRNAFQRLYVRALSRFHGAELEKYAHVIAGHAAAYASLSHVLRSPLRHVETPLFLSGLVLFISSIVSAANGEANPIVAAGMSAALVAMVNCARRLARYWEEYAVREAVFLELEENLRKEELP